MRRTLVAALTAVTVVALAPGANAHPAFHYEGGCMFWGVSDGTDDPQTQWDGEIRVVASATDINGTPTPTAQISVSCELVINGSTPGTVVFEAQGLGAAASSGLLTYHADPDDFVSMCDVVTVNGERHTECRLATVASFVPKPFEELIHTILDDNALSGALCEHAGDTLCENGDPLHPEVLHAVLCIGGIDWL